MRNTMTHYWIDDTGMLHLFDGLHAGGCLNLRCMPVKALPDGLSVAGNLDISYTAVTALPDGLSVGGELCARRTRIKALPEDIALGGKRISDAPIIDDIHRRVYEAASASNGTRLDMRVWHSECGTAHCRAGWVVTLAGDAGRALEARIGTANAAHLIYAASDPTRPLVDFYASGAEALRDMRARARS